MSDNHKLLNNPHKTAAGYAHEIKNPITAVRGLLQLLANPDLPALKRSLYTEIAIEELDRANGLLYEMVHNNPPANRQETTNMKEAITKTTLLFEQAIQSKNLQLETFFAGNFNVQIPKQQLAQVLANILKNAIEASRANGRITISAYTERQFGIISIKDNGPGISPEALDMLFTPYFTTKRTGTGLGLSICQSIIHEANGQITVHSEFDAGTEFIVKLPIC
ncbi:HAMP domain-containing sensor histidine kinase [Niallia taxi]|uniref:two-component system sensor histidine kinase NtrB n=1 Tax=Niallia taxi TaxID=2499688 RepID=UPI003982B3E1